MYDILWWVSALSRLDTRDSIEGVWQLNTSELADNVVPPEEVTTFNLVRRLASMHRTHKGSPIVALHSRILEGGTSTTVKSGADMQLAIEVRPDEWAHIVFQAKRQFLPGGEYRQWKQNQLDAMRKWAVARGAQSAVLLYNTSKKPFKDPGAGSLIPLGSCCQPKNRCHGHRWPTWSLPDPRSPLAVTMIPLPCPGKPLPPELVGDGLHPRDVNAHAMPWECVMCPRKKSFFPTHATMPKWAKELGELEIAAMEVGPPDLLGGYAQEPDTRQILVQEDLEPWTEGWTPAYSVVLNYVPNKYDSPDDADDD